MATLQWIYLLQMVMFHSNVRLPEATFVSMNRFKLSTCQHDTGTTSMLASSYDLRDMDMLHAPHVFMGMVQKLWPE